MRCLELAEWGVKTLPGAVMSHEDLRLADRLRTIDKERFHLDPLVGGVRARATSWVGVARFSTFEVRVRPKLAGDYLGLIDLIEYVARLGDLRRNPAVRTLCAQGSGLFDVLALLLAEDCRRIILDGLLLDYLEREEDLGAVRGRILVDEQVLRRFGRVDRVACRFDEQEQDVLENQILAAALRVCMHGARDPAVRRAVRYALDVFEVLCSPVEVDLAGWRGALTYNRLNEHYRTAHELAFLLLEGVGVDDLMAAGATRCFSFFMNMNSLFERFVWRLIDDHLRGTGLRATYQAQDRSIWNATTGRPLAPAIPDILVQPRGADSPRLAVDAKYKKVDERGVSHGDIYQTFFYAFTGTQTKAECPAALIVYPASKASGASARLEVRDQSRHPLASIHVLGIDIPAALDEVKRGVVSEAIGPLLNRIHECLDCEEIAAVAT